MANGGKKLSIIILLLSLAGSVLAGLSLKHFLLLRIGAQQEPSFCNINATFNCDLVNSSSFSTFFGFPLASYGLAFYALFAVVSLLSFFNLFFAERSYKAFVFVVGLFSSLLSILLFVISEVYIGSLCLLCIAMYFVNFLILAAAYFVNREGTFWGNISNSFSTLFGIPVKLLLFSAVYIALVFGVSAYAHDYAVINYLPKELPPQLTSNPAEEWFKQIAIEIPVRSEGSSKDYQAGPLDAPIHIVKFSDYECPACKRFYHLLEPLLEEYKGKVLITFKNYPLDSSCNLSVNHKMHPNACHAAYFARCAGEQGKFWEATDFLFDLQGDATQFAEQISNGISLLSLDKFALDECIAAERTKKKVTADIDAGNNLKIMGTPSVWINGKHVKNYNTKVVRDIFDKILSEKKN